MKLKYTCTDAGQYGLNVPADRYVAEHAGIRLLRTSDLADGTLTDGDSGIFVEPPIDERFLLRPDDILLSRSGTIGRTYLTPPEAAGMVFAGFLVRFRPRCNVEPRYLTYALQSTPVQERIQVDAIASTIQNFNADRYANLDLNIPGTDEQRRIADYLDAECARLDRLIYLRERHMTLVHERNISELDKIVDCHAARMVRLGRLATIQSGITVDGSRASSGAEEVPYLRVANVQAGALDLTEVKTIPVSSVLHARYLLREGDVLMTEGGDLDKLGRGTVWRSEIPGAIHQNHVFAVRPRRDVLLSDYLAVVTASSPARRHFESTGSKTTNLASTSSSKVMDLRVPLRPLADQQAIVTKAHISGSRADALMSKMCQGIELLRERKQALITAAVTGEFDVSAASGRGA